ncbi:MAG: helix-turn-helix domain-containing protein, partial [Bacteroidota bacterium]
YFGGTKGVTRFSTAKIPHVQPTSRLIFSGLRVGNQMVRPGEKINDQQILSRRLNYIEAIQLHHQNNSFEITFSDLNFNVAPEASYQYRLWNWDQEWRETTGKDPRVIYGNLPPDTYRLELRKKGTGSKETLVMLQVEILPPWWATWWFRMSMVIGLILLGMGISKFRVEQLKKQRTLLARQVLDRTEALNLQSGQLKAANKALRQNQEALHQQNKQIESMAEVLHQKDQSKIKLLLNLSHEFRNSLSLIIDPLTQLQQQKAGKIQDMFRAHQVVSQRITHLMQLVNRSLDLSRMEARDSRLELKSVCLDRKLMDVLASFGYHVEKAHLHYRYTLAPDLGRAMVDWGKIEQVLINLLSNALKYTDPHGRIGVEVQSDVEKAHILIDVANTCSGLDKKEVDQFFTYLYRGKNSTDKAGTGIGLSMCKELVSIMRGQIEAQYEDNMVSVRVRIPFVAAETSVASSDSPIVQAKIPSDIQKPYLLLIEDHVALRAHLFEALSHDYEVVALHDARLLRSSLAERLPDLILCDWELPELSGQQILRVLREEPDWAQIPVLVLTADTEVEKQVLEAGAVDYMVKPISLDILTLRLRRFLLPLQAVRERHAFVQHLLDSLRVAPLQQPEDQWLRSLVAWLETTYASPSCTGLEMAENMHLSKAQLYRRVRQVLGITVHDLITRYRLFEARKLISTGELKLADIAMKSGFSSQSYLSRCYKRVYGFAPSRQLQH